MVALMISLLLVVLLTSAFILIIKGIVRFRREQRRSGVVYCLLGTLIACTFLVLVVPPMMYMGEKTPRIRCMANLSCLGKASYMYAMDHEESFPTSFNFLAPNYANHPKLYLCPSPGKEAGQIDNVDQWTDYVLVTNLTTKSNPRFVLAYCKTTNHIAHTRGRFGCSRRSPRYGAFVLYVDGSVSWVDEKDFDNLPCDIGSLSRINNRNFQEQPDEARQP